MRMEDRIFHSPLWCKRYGIFHTPRRSTQIFHPPQIDVLKFFHPPPTVGLKKTSPWKVQNCVFGHFWTFRAANLAEKSKFQNSRTSTVLLPSDPGSSMAKKIKKHQGWISGSLRNFSYRQQIYGNFLDIWYENHQIWPKIKKLLRNFETSNESIFKKLEGSKLR